MATFDKFISSLREEFGEQDAGNKFEVFCKWFLENDPEWSKSIDKVWLWDKYPNKWQSQDLGTDLVFHDKDGLVWAVQAKCYSEHRSTTKGDMNSFLADTGRSEVDRRLWLQTTNKIEAKAEKTCKGQDKKVTFFNLNNFRDAQIDYPMAFSELYKAKVKIKPIPEPHQREAIEDVSSRLKTVDRGQLIMACGTGKTFTTMWIKEELKAHSTLVLLPSLSLLSQTMREWAWASNTDFEILNVCSDKSVGKKTEDMKPEDAPFPVTSKVEEIIKFLKKPKPKVIFCTYQSSPLIAEAHENSAISDFDLIISDEAHRCAGKAEAGFATVLDGNKIRSSKRLFTTATPRYFGKAIKDAAKAKDLAVVGMDDEEVFGSVLHKLTFGKAIQDGHLTDYQVVIIGVDEPMVKQYIDEQEIVAINTDETTDARTLAAKIGLLKAIKDYDLKRVISFHSRVSGAKMFSEELIDVVNIIDPKHRPEGTFLTNYVSGTMKAGDRKDKIDKLKALENHDRGILTNARCLAEGVDVPSLDGVAFIDPKGSQVEIIQAVGRSIRKVRGVEIQKKGTIVIPVFIEDGDGDDPETSIEKSNFKPVWDVLKALRAHDEILADELDQYRTNMAKYASQGSKDISEKVIFDIPSNIGNEFSNALKTIIIESSSASWEFCFGLLEVFIKREGHCRVPAMHLEGDYKLGNWVGTQRKLIKKMGHYRKEKLNAIGFIWDPFQEAWDEGFSYLVKQRHIKGHCGVRFDYILEGFELGSWVGTQRKTKKKRLLTNERIEKLNSIGFIWDAKEDAWYEGFNYLAKYQALEGHCRLPEAFEIEGFKLSYWVSRQRREKKKGTLTTDRVEKLNSIGFSWDPYQEDWDQGFYYLGKYKMLEGDSNAPRGYKLDGFNLGDWVGTQRKHFSKNLLTEDKIEKLNSIGFLWDPVEVAWYEGFNHLQIFKEREGHCKVPRYHIENNLKLGVWVKTQRTQRFYRDSIDPDRKNKLDALGFIWDPLTEQWEESYSKLLQFKEREGHCKVLQEHKEGDFKLGVWVSIQRLNKKRNTLSQERKKRLDAIGFVWDARDEIK
ncbi:Helicase associated domain protein [Amylibacter sp.]|nr:Helicase associated domain protein [Amylibacter sp.]